MPSGDCSGEDHERSYYERSWEGENEQNDPENDDDG